VWLCSVSCEQRVQYKYSDRNILLSKMYLPSAFLITIILKDVIVHIVHYISVSRYLIGVNEMFIL
jgi:hypothetical protein